MYSRHNLDEDMKNLLKTGRQKFGNSFLSYEAGSFFQSKQSYARAMDEYIIYLSYNKNRQNIIQRRISRMSDDSDAVEIILSKLILISEKEPKKFYSYSLIFISNNKVMINHSKLIKNGIRAVIGNKKNGYFCKQPS